MKVLIDIRCHYLLFSHYVKEFLNFFTSLLRKHLVKRIYFSKGHPPRMQGPYFAQEANKHERLLVRIQTTF